MADKVHLVRHGEVHNPDNLVYASLPGFGLNDTGRRQAEAAARYLAFKPLVAVWSSPLQRAVETASEIARRAGLPVQVCDELIEWRLADSWAGIRWDELSEHRPGELERYLSDPLGLDVGTESLSRLASRMTGAVESLHRRHPEGEIVIVSHQDPVQAARLLLIGRRLESLQKDKPSHASVVTLQPGTPWKETARWAPAHP